MRPYRILGGGAWSPHVSSATGVAMPLEHDEATPECRARSSDCSEAVGGPAASTAVGVRTLGDFGGTEDHFGGVEAGVHCESRKSINPEESKVEDRSKSYQTFDIDRTCIAHRSNIA